MARPNLTRHRKFARLVRLIGSKPIARGSLELLWDAAYENGDDLLGEAGDVEQLAEWGGEEGLLARALLAAGFIDQDGDVFRVHDLWDHAPEYVATRRSKEAERRKPKTCAICGTEFHSPEAKARYCSGACRTAAWRSRAPGEPAPVTDGDADHRHGDAGVRHGDDAVTHGDDSHAPAPAHAPEREPLQEEQPLLLSPPKPLKATDRQHRTLFEALSEELEAARPGATVDRTKDPAAVKRLLGWAKGDVAEARRRFRAALAAPPPFRCDTIAQLASTRIWNHFAPSAAADQPQAKLRPLAAPGAR